MKTNRLVFQVALTGLIWTFGCATPKPIPDPLSGWNALGSAYVIGCPFGKSICDDYQKYIQTLSSVEQFSADEFHVHFFENPDGLKSVEITVNLNGTRWKHVLFYDNKNARIKTIKYASSRYRS